MRNALRKAPVVAATETVFVATQEVFREEPALTTPPFNRLLEWLDNGVESHGEMYLEMRRRLVSYFDRRNRDTADDLADETLNRIARTLENDGAIATMSTESLEPEESIEIQEQRLACLERCLEELGPHALHGAWRRTVAPPPSPLPATQLTMR
jgi:hypothetical protein